MRLIVRVFAPASSSTAAHAVAQRLMSALQRHAPVAVNPPEPYWKVPEWYEHTIALFPPLRDTFDAVVALASAGWSHLDRDVEMNSVWNPQPGVAFLLPEVTWAELMLVHDPEAHVLYLRSNGVALSREGVADWRDLQERHADYMASLGPWTLVEILDHFATQFGPDESRWPLRRAAIEHFMSAGTELVLRAEQRT